jgi:hypothetical protein
LIGLSSGHKLRKQGSILEVDYHDNSSAKHYDYIEGIKTPILPRKGA